jgi:hypothetical protein
MHRGIKKISKKKGSKLTVKHHGRQESREKVVQQKIDENSR